MRVLVCGDRNWGDEKAVQDVLSFMGPNDVLIQGGARGADNLAAEAALTFGCQLQEFPADWKKLGKAAGPIRNQQMLDEGQPDLVIAFHDDLGNSKGTKDMVLRARKAGLRVFLVEHDFDGTVNIGTNAGPLLDHKIVITDPVLRQIRDILL